MQERAARILAELEYVQSRACGTLRYALGRCAWLTAFAKAASALNLTLALSLLLNFKFRPCRAAFKFHHREHRRLNFAAMRVRRSKHCVTIQNAVKFYLLDTVRRF